MPIKNGKKATRVDIVEAIRKNWAIVNIEFEVVLPEARPHHMDYISREHRAYIKVNGKPVLTAPSAYELLKKIEDGWKYKPELEYQEGIFVQNEKEE